LIATPAALYRPLTHLATIASAARIAASAVMRAGQRRTGRVTVMLRARLAATIATAIVIATVIVEMWIVVAATAEARPLAPNCSQSPPNRWSFCCIAAPARVNVSPRRINKRPPLHVPRSVDK
jgi:hypothetical protein